MHAFLRISMRRGLYIVLAGQCLIALFLLASDLGARWLPDLSSDRDAVRPPVSPGDQVRPYNPSRLTPEYTAPTASPEMKLPSGMPDRLVFSVEDAGDRGKVLLMNGAIENGDAERFRAYLADLGRLSIPVALNSPGGSVSEAQKIGSMLRDKGATTVVLPGMVCVSSCPYIVAGGVKRLISKGGAVGLHQHYYDAPGYLPVFLAVSDIQYGQGQTMLYLIGMGIDPGVMVHSLRTPPNDIYILLEDELLTSRLATELID